MLARQGADQEGPRTRDSHPALHRAATARPCSLSDLRFPLIVKLLDVTRRWASRRRRWCDDALAERVRFHDKFDTDAIVEEFIAGELYTGVM
jgi:hypothetical protein